MYSARYYYRITSLDLKYDQQIFTIKKKKLREKKPCTENMFRYRFLIHKKCIIHTLSFQIRLFSATTTSSPFLRSSEKEHAQHAGNHYVQVPNRSLIEIEGNDSAKFLQGIITNNMNAMLG